MSRETENIFRQLEVFLEQHADEYENIDEAINDYVARFNDGLIDELEDDTSRVLDLLDEAMVSDDADERLALLKEANQLEPDNLDVYCALCFERYDDIEAVSLIEEKTKEYLKTHRRFIKEASYAGVENRPYFRARRLLLDFYKEQLLF